MIRNIVFDMGQVLIRWTPELMLSFYELTDAEHALLEREVFLSAEWAATDRGVVPEEQLVERMCRRLPASLHPIAAECVTGWWKHPFVPVPGIEELIRELRKNGYTLYVLSNASRAIHGYFSRLPAAECFSGFLVSADWGVVKPERTIYTQFYDLFGLAPEECFFIDDNRMNIEAAEMTGMRGAVFFQDTARLRKELAEAGISVSGA